MSNKANRIIFLEPVMKEVLWGGDRLHTDFNYDIPSDHTGECWAVSAHPNGDCMVSSGLYQGKLLSQLWRDEKVLFGNRKEAIFPLLIKILDAKQDLSIQVHPDDVYANKYENGALGKTECWYILDCDENASIVIGHHAKSKEEVEQMIHNEEWDKFIRVVPIKKGDFFQITPGTVHAIKAGTLILETQQNSDITYRVYDYDRMTDGKKRELHVQKSIDVIKAPYIEEAMDNKKITSVGDMTIELLESCPYYTVERQLLDGTAVLNQNKDFRIYSVIEGSGTIDGVPMNKGCHFILPYQYGDYTLTGKMELISSYL